MNNNFIRGVVSISFIVIIYYSCGMAIKKRHDVSEIPPEGYVVLSFGTFNDADVNGFPIDEIPVHDSNLLTGHRQMFIKGHYLIDIKKNIHSVDGKYIRTDTLYYEFYDLAAQKFVSFEHLSLNSKIMKKGSMEDPEGSFSNTPLYDPMNGIGDSLYKVTDTVINRKRQGVAGFILTNLTDSLDREFTKRTKFWIDYEAKNFPLQLSYILSKKFNSGFVYKMQQSLPDGKSVMVTALDYQPAKLPDRIIKIFEKWSQIVNE